MYVMRCSIGLKKILTGLDEAAILALLEAAPPCPPVLIKHESGILLSSRPEDAQTKVRRLEVQFGLVEPVYTVKNPPTYREVRLNVTEAEETALKRYGWRTLLLPKSEVLAPETGDRPIRLQLPLAVARLYDVNGTIPHDRIIGAIRVGVAPEVDQPPTHSVTVPELHAKVAASLAHAHNTTIARMLDAAARAGVSAVRRGPGVPLDVPDDLDADRAVGAIEWLADRFATGMPGAPRGREALVQITERDWSRHALGVKRSKAAGDLWRYV